jgi:hypothetical protein
MKYQLRRGYISLLFILFSIFNNTIYAQVIRLTWNPNIEPDIKYYLIYRDTMTNPINEISRVYKPNTTYFDDDIIIGKGYYYRIAAVDSADNISEFSDDIYVYADNFTRVNLISFTAEVIDDKIVLRWKITPKNDNFSFEIQRSDDSENFNQIGFVSDCRTSPDLATYYFIDSDLSHVKSYYRLKRVGADGNFEYSNVIKVELSLPGKFKLSQNYPNPFNPETTIRYSMAKEGKVSLIIFDILGKEIRKLVDEHKRAGYYEVKWDGKDNYGINASSGIYFCRMRVDGFCETKKIMLSR